MGIGKTRAAGTGAQTPGILGPTDASTIASTTAENSSATPVSLKNLRFS